jgi:hypothetical protein
MSVSWTGGQQEREHERVSELPKEQPKVRRVATGETFRKRWEEMDDEQRRDYLKSAEQNAPRVTEDMVTRASHVLWTEVRPGTCATTEIATRGPSSLTWGPDQLLSARALTD